MSKAERFSTALILRKGHYWFEAVQIQINKKRLDSALHIIIPFQIFKKLF